MNFFSSGLKSVLGTQEAAQQPSGAETVERLVERVLSSTLLEDRRDACRALKSLSRKYRVEVGAHGMSAFTYVLQTDYADCEIVGYALDALCNITSDEDFDEEEWQDTNYKPGSNLGAQFTEIFIKQPDNVGLVLSFLEEYDFRVRWPAVKLLKSLLSSKPKEVQDIVLVSPMGVSKLMDLLSDSREVIRNDALLLLLQLTKGNANIQKIVAFENAFDRLFDVINDEGYADGDIVVEDCLLLMLNLLKNNVSNQNFFKEGSYIQRLAPMFNILNDDELDVGLTPQKVSNINAVLQIIRTLVSPANPGQATASCQKALRATGIVEKLCSILMAGGVPVDVLTETIITVAEVIRGNLSNQEYFASVMAPSNPPKEAIVVLLMSMVNERQPFFLRCAVLYSFQCYLYRNEMGQTKLIQTLLPSTSEQPSVTAGQLLCGGLFSHDVLSHWLSSVALSHALIENPAAKESMLRVLLTPVSSHTPLSLLHHITLLLQQSNKVQSKLGLLILLATWLSHCPPAIRHFLSIDTSISYLTTQAGATEHDDNEELVQGLCAFIMGICTHFNDDSVPSFSKENLRQLINKRVGLEVFLDKLNEVSRHEMYSRAVKHPNIRVNSPNDLLLDHEFCKLFKALEGLVMKAVTVSATDLTNGPSENIEQYKNLIREQDKRITELSMHYEALHAQNVEQAAKIQELTDQNLILKAQLSTTSAASQMNQGSPHGINVVQEKDQTIARLEEELKNLRLHLENRPLSAAESQAVDSEVIYLKSQVQALQQTERELMELRKDQEDLLELVADQEREIELLKSQLRVNQEKEDQRQEDIRPIKQEPFEPSPDREEKPQPENISEAQGKPQMISSNEVHPWLLLLSKEGDLAKDFESPLPSEYQRDLKSLDSASSSPAPTPELKFDSSPVILPPTTPLSTPTPPTQISGSSRSTPNIFSPVPFPSPKPPSTGPPSPGPVTVPLSALSGDSDAPVGDFSNISIEPLEVTTLPTEPIAIPKSSTYSTHSWQATSNATESVPLSQPNSSENSASIHSPPSNTISPPTTSQQSGMSMFFPFSSFASGFSGLSSGASTLPPSSNESQLKSEEASPSTAFSLLRSDDKSDSPVLPVSSVGPPPRMQPSPGVSIFTPASSDVNLTKSETAPPTSDIGPPPKSAFQPPSGISIFTSTRSNAIPNDSEGLTDIGPPPKPAFQPPTGISIFTPAYNDVNLNTSESSDIGPPPKSVVQPPSGVSIFNPTNSDVNLNSERTPLNDIGPPPKATIQPPPSIFNTGYTDISLNDSARNSSPSPKPTMQPPTGISIFTPTYNDLNLNDSERVPPPSDIASPPGISAFTTNQTKSEADAPHSIMGPPPKTKPLAGMSIFSSASSDTNSSKSDTNPYGLRAHPGANKLPSGVSIFTPASITTDEKLSEPINDSSSAQTVPSSSSSLPPQIGNQSVFAPVKHQTLSDAFALPNNTTPPGVSIFTPPELNETKMSQNQSSYHSNGTAPQQSNPIISFFNPLSSGNQSQAESQPSSVLSSVLFSPQNQPNVSVFNPLNSDNQRSQPSSVASNGIYSSSNPSGVADFIPQSSANESQYGALAPSHSNSLFSPASQRQLHSTQPTTVFTPMPQPATYPYQQNAPYQQAPHAIPQSSTEPQPPTASSLFSFQSSNTSPFPSMFPAAPPPGNQVSPPMHPPTQPPTHPPTQPPPQQQSGLFSFMNPSSYFSSQSSQAGTQPTSIFSAPSSVMSNNIFPS